MNIKIMIALAAICFSSSAFSAINCPGGRYYYDWVKKDVEVCTSRTETYTYTAAQCGYAGWISLEYNPNVPAYLPWQKYVQKGSTIEGATSCPSWRWATSTETFGYYDSNGIYRIDWAYWSGIIYNTSQNLISEEREREVQDCVTETKWVKVKRCGMIP